MKRNYEIIFIIYPYLGNKIQSFLKEYFKIMEPEIHNLEYWGKLNLAYPIKKQDQGHFIYLNLSCRPKTIIDLKKSTFFDKNIMRHLVLQTKNKEPCCTCMSNNENIDLTLNLRKDLDINIDINLQEKNPLQEEISYKNLNLISKYISSETKSIVSLAHSSFAKKRRKIASAIKTARFLSLLPYCDKYRIL